MKRAIFAGLLLAGCTAISTQDMVIEGREIRVLEHSNGNWVAVDRASRLNYPASNIPVMIRAIEAVSGCAVDRDAIVPETYAITVAVICS